MNFIQIIFLLRSLCFGGLLGVAAAIALCFYFNQAQYIPYAAILSGSLGATMQRGIMCVFTSIINFVGYYAKLFQVELLRRYGIIDEATCNEIKRQNTLSYFKVENSVDRSATGKILSQKPEA